MLRIATRIKNYELFSREVATLAFGEDRCAIEACRRWPTQLKANAVADPDFSLLSFVAYLEENNCPIIMTLQEQLKTKKPPSSIRRTKTSKKRVEKKTP